jgi:hypothetical protein
MVSAARFLARITLERRSVEASPPLCQFSDPLSLSARNALRSAREKIFLVRFTSKVQRGLVRLTTYPLGGDSSKYAYVSLAISVLASTVLAFLWRERLACGGHDSTRIRQPLMIASLWTASASAIGQLVFSLYRLFHPPYRGVHEGPVLAIALLGLLVSFIALLSVFAAGPRKWVVVCSSLVLTLVWFLAILDNINW